MGNAGVRLHPEKKSQEFSSLPFFPNEATQRVLQRLNCSTLSPRTVPDTEGSKIPIDEMVRS